MAENRSRDRRQLMAIMIGALDEFEKSFGYLWGHELGDDDQPTETQEQFWDLWQDTRTSILDRGNDKINQILERRRIRNYEKRY